ncbi:MAG TPA: helix-turn-helix domain-containing protein [Steroidobacteraceae bacterium]|nr:helix-turn-helix domain-containing protein [Steroidobacteraceae bacterium]
MRLRKRRSGLLRYTLAGVREGGLNVTIQALNHGGGRLPVPDPRGVFTADTLDEATSLVRAAICPHRLHVNEPPRKSVAFLSSLDLGACGLTNLRYGFDVDIDAGRIGDTYLVKWTLAGQGQLWCGDRTAITSPRSIVITEPTEHTKIRMTAQCQHLTVRVSRRALLETLAAKLSRPLRKDLHFNLEIPMDSDFARAWCELVAHICHISATAPAALANEGVRKQYSRTLMEIMLSAAPNSHTDSIDEPMNRATAWHVGRARDYVHDHLSEGISITDIAARVGVTPRTLQNGFRKAFNLTPAEYIRRARVAALHQALLAADANAGVANLMTNVGIVNFGRYAQYYREQIGVSPSTTLKRKAQ